MKKKSLIRIGLCFSVFFASASACSAATLGLGSSSAQTVGDTFSVPVYASAVPGESLNAIAATIAFPPEKLRVVLVDDGGIVDFWAQKPAYSNTNGTISFQGVTYNPGFSGKNGKVLTITFRVLKSGAAQLAFVSPSILANDGQGTDILTSATGVTIALQAVAPSSTNKQSSRTPKSARAATVATSSLATTPVATSSAPHVLFDVSAQPVTLSAVPSKVTFAVISDDLLYTVELLFVGTSLLGILFFFVWYVWHRMHRTRRRILRHIASTDTELHAELFELHNALKEEVARLRHEQDTRVLTREEKRILVRFAYLVEKTAQVVT